MRKLPLTFLLIFSAFCLKGMADTITLKDGTVIEGTITQQDDTQLTVTYNVSETITDTRILKLTEVVKIEKTPEDSLAFEPLKKLKPDPWSMVDPDACARIIDELKAFLKQYPQSTHKAEVQAILDTFLGEQRHEQAGDVKLYGGWISKDEAATRDSQFQAQALYLRMEASVKQGDIIGALNAFDQLEKTHPSSRIYPTAIEQARELVTQLQGDVNNAINTLKVTDAQWQQGVVITPEPEKSQMVAARQDEITKAETAVDAALSSGVKWPPFIPNSQKSLDTLTTVTKNEQSRLLALHVDKMNASLVQSDKAAELIAANDLVNAQIFLKNAAVLWPTSEEAGYSQRALDSIKAAAAAAQHPAKPTSSARPSRTPAPVVAAAASPASTAKPASTPAQTPEPAPKQSLVDFLFTIPGALTVVVCAVGLILISSFLQKSKKNRIDEEEQ